MTERLHFHFYALEKEMATHSSGLAWRIPGMGSHRVGHDISDLAAVLHCRYIPNFLYGVTHQGTLRLFPHLGYCD